MFSTPFSSNRIVQNRVSEIREIRNEVAHPDSSDLNEEETRVHLYMIADVLGRINRPDSKDAVEEIRNRLFNADESDQATDDDSGQPSPVGPSMGEIFEDGSYHFTIFDITERISYENKPYLKVDFKHDVSERLVWRSYPLQPQSLWALRTLMGEFGIVVDYLEEAVEQKDARARLAAELRKDLLDAKVILHLGKREWNGRESNSVERVFRAPRQ